MTANNGKRTIEEKQGFNDEQIKAVQQILNSKDDWSKFGLHPSNTTKDDVKRMYKHLAKLIHPDKCTVPGHEEAFKELTKIKKSLSEKCH